LNASDRLRARDHGIASDRRLRRDRAALHNRQTVEDAPDMRVYTPLELAGRNIYIREGCYACHSQMIRTLRDEVERYGPYSLAVESKYDHPMLWGSKRTGPDLARIGSKYSDAWHVAHLINPRAWCRNRSCRPMPGCAQRARIDDLGARQPESHARGRRALYRRPISDDRRNERSVALRKLPISRQSTARCPFSTVSATEK
jgi:hypothetical protein